MKQLKKIIYEIGLVYTKQSKKMKKYGEHFIYNEVEFTGKKLVKSEVFPLFCTTLFTKNSYRHKCTCRCNRSKALTKKSYLQQTY